MMTAAAPRVLYLSQLAEPTHPRRALLPDESRTVPPVFRSLGVEIEVVDVTQSQPPVPDGFLGVVAGGSFGSANDGERWRLELAAYLLRLNTTPLLGICGGHQLLAYARGGRLGTLPARRSGVYPLDLPDVPGFEGTVVQMNGDLVTEPPAGAVVWARDEVGIQALRYGPACWTVQFHPELSLPVALRTREDFGNGSPRWETSLLKGAVTNGHAVIRAWLEAARVQRAGTP
jgi:GMP synthase-like glutamine amidotransferase